MAHNVTRAWNVVRQTLSCETSDESRAEKGMNFMGVGSETHAEREDTYRMTEICFLTKLGEKGKALIFYSFLFLNIKSIYFH